jgi:hypothetical protein
VIEFRTSTFCSLGDCVEVGIEPGSGAVAVRDTKDRAQQQLVFSREEWSAFVVRAKDGRYDFA